MDLLELVAGFTESEAHAAERFELLSRHMRPFMRRIISDIAVREDDREDAVSETLVRLWGRRQSLRFSRLSAWFAYVAKVARSVALSQRAGKEVLSDLEFDLVEADAETVDTLAWLSLSRERLYQAADELWLGAPPGNLRFRGMRRLACQWFYLDGFSLDEVLRLLPPGACTRRELSGWLTSVDALAELAFSEVYFSNAKLVARLTAVETQVDSMIELALADMPQENRGGWSGIQLRIVLLRYGLGLLTEKICQLCGVSETEVEQVVELVSTRLPFRASASGFVRCIFSKGSSESPLQQAGLYKRLAFQYFAADELPQKQILERTEPVAEVGGYRLTPGMLNVWLSNGRLFTQLASFVRQEAECV